MSQLAAANHDEKSLLCFFFYATLKCMKDLRQRRAFSLFMVAFRTTRGVFPSVSIVSPILTAHNQGAEENPNRVMTGMLLCSGLLVESVGADRQDHLRTGALEIKQDTLGV